MRRGQLLSMDALVSLVLVIMILGTVSATSESLRSGITSMIGWYERANIADNMLDVLTKSPGVPEDWYTNINSLKVLGLKSNTSILGLDYNRVRALALNFNNPSVLSVLKKMSLGKDFSIEFYLSSFQVSIEGSFPRIYIPNITFTGRNGKGVRFDLQGSPQGNDYFSVSYIKITKANGSVYIDENITALTGKNGKNININKGDTIEIVTGSTTYLTTTGADISPELCNKDYSSGNTCVIGPLPKNTEIIIYAKSLISNFQIQLETKGDWRTIRLTSGQGSIVVTVFAYDNTTPKVSTNYTLFTNLWEKKSPTYWFAVINGTPTQDRDLVAASMNSSPWVESAERVITISHFDYNLSAGPSAVDPLVYGILVQPVPLGAYLSVSAPDTKGNATFVALSGSHPIGLMIYRNQRGDPLKGVLVENTTAGVVVKQYPGTTSSVSIPLKDIFGEEGNRFAGLWFYSLGGWDRSEVSIYIVPSIKWDLEPKSEPALVKLMVWDDP